MLFKLLLLYLNCFKSIPIYFYCLSIPSYLSDHAHMMIFNWWMSLFLFFCLFVRNVPITYWENICNHWLRNHNPGESKSSKSPEDHTWPGSHQPLTWMVFKVSLEDSNQCINNTKFLNNTLHDQLLYTSRTMPFFNYNNPIFSYF